MNDIIILLEEGQSIPLSDQMDSTCSFLPLQMSSLEYTMSMMAVYQ